MVSADQKQVMSYCKEEGKDKIVFVTKEDDETPLGKDATELSKALINDKDDVEGPLHPNGEINWSCPCMASMVSGPCGYAFRKSFECFHYSKADPKGSDCLEPFIDMRKCFEEHPKLYDMYDDDEEDDLMDPSNASASSETPNPKHSDTKPKPN